MSPKKETPHERLIRFAGFAEPEHHHCPGCNTVLVAYPVDREHHVCPNCLRHFLVIEGEVLSEVA